VTRRLQETKTRSPGQPVHRSPSRDNLDSVQVENVARHVCSIGRRRANENTMKKKVEKRVRREKLRPEYDLSKLNGGVRGKYIERYRAGTNLVLLSPDVAKHFPDEQSVNQALRGLIQAAKGTQRRGS